MAKTNSLQFTVSLFPSLSSSSLSAPIIRFNSRYLPTTKSSSLNICSTSTNNPSFIHLQPKLFSSPIRASTSSEPLNDGEGRDSDGFSRWVQPLIEFAGTNFLPLALIGGVILGLANPSLGCFADKYYLSKVSTFGIFIISGLTLRSQEIGAATEAWPVGLFGLASILLLTPTFSKLLLLLNFQPQEFVTGLAIFTCMPTTLSSGVSLTQLAGGNFALALAMTVISNLLGILVVPFTITKFVAAGVGLTIPTKQLFRSLVMTLLIPLILGKVWYVGQDKVPGNGARNGVGVVFDERLSQEVIETRWKSDTIIRVKLLCGKEVVNVISAYASQVDLEAEKKRKFWEDFDEVVQGVPHNEKLFIGGDLNGHVGTSRDGFECVHGGFGYGHKDAHGETIMDFAQSYAG